MSSHSPSPLSSGYSTPYPMPIYSPALAAAVKPPRAPKPTNVFTNDGSFLERVQRSKREEEEKKRQEELQEKRKAFDNRFRNRGKRPPPDNIPNSVTTTDIYPITKKAKTRA